MEILPPNFLSLNDDALGLILLNLKPADFYRTCQAHPRITQICNNWYFQQQYEEKWRPGIIRKLDAEFKHNPERAFYLAGKYNNLNLVKYLISRYPQSFTVYLCQTFEGAGYSGSEDFIKVLWNLFEDFVNKGEIVVEYKEDMEGCIVAGIANSGNWDLLEKFTMDINNMYYYLEGLIKGNHIDQLLEYLNSRGIGDISNESLYPDLLGRLIYVAVENNDSTILEYLLQKYPHFADAAAISSLSEGKTVLFNKLERLYPLFLDKKYIYAVLNYVGRGGARSLLDFLGNKMGIDFSGIEIPEYIPP